MSDIDFDELDQAVNSLMGKAATPKEGAGASQNTLSIDSTLQPEENPQYDALNKVAQKIGSESLETQKTVTADLGPVNETARVVKLEPKLPENAPLPPLANQELPVAKQPSTGRFMDVVHPSSDMRAGQPATNTVPQLVGPVSPSKTEQPAQATPTPVSQPTATPPPPAEIMSSPFLADAKVEKRPLGGEPPTGGSEMPAVGANTGDQQQSLDEDVLEEPSNSDQQNVLNAEDFGSETKSEEKQLQSIESAYDTGTSNQVLRTIESGDTEKMLNDAAQLVEKSGPRIQPKKQKSGLTIVIVIAVIIVLSVAVAGAAYFFVINKP